MAYSAIGSKYGLLAVLLFSVLNSEFSQAQVFSNDPAATQQREKENRERIEQQRRLKERPDESPAVNAPAVPELKSSTADADVKFSLTAVEFSESEWLNEEELDLLAAAYIKENSSFASLKQLVNDINRYYRSRGIVTAQAILPPQKIANGIVKITLVEGRVGKVVVADNHSTMSDYITNRVPLEADQLIRVTELEQALARFNRVEDLQLRAQMEKGSEFGRTDIVLKALEPARQLIELFASNTGTDETGETRGGVSYTNNSVLGYRDSVNFSALGSSDSEGYVFSYNVPVNRSGGRVGFNYLRDDLDIDSEAFSDLDIDADSQTRSLDFTQPIYSAADSALRFSAGLEESKSVSRIDGLLVQQSEVESVPLNLQWDQYFERDLLFINASFSRGREREFDSRYFTSYRVNLTYLHMIDDQLSLITRMAGQHSDDDNLPGGQVFQIGGATSVRGYEEGLVSGDKGAFVNLELQWDLSNKLELELPMTLTPMVFLDQGVVYPYLPDASQFAKKHYLGSAGAGINFDIANALFGSVTIGFPVRKDNFEQDGSRIHFNVVYRPYAK
jgi:hemolysin activation/secretion protein